MLLHGLFGCGDGVRSLKSKINIKSGFLKHYMKNEENKR